MNADLTKAMEAIDRRAEEYKADVKMHNVVHDMAVDILTLCKWFRNASEEIERLKDELRRK